MNIFLTIATTILIGFVGGAAALISTAFIRSAMQDWREGERMMAGMALIMGLLPSMMLLGILTIVVAGESAGPCVKHEERMSRFGAYEACVERGEWIQ